MGDSAKQATQLVAETTKNVADDTQVVGWSWLSDFFSKVPDGVWVALAVAVVGAIGWFCRTGYDAWKQSRLPFKQDRDRYQAVMAAVVPDNLHHLKEAPLNLIRKAALDGIDDAFEAMSDLRKVFPSYLHEKLAPRENELFIALGELCEFLPLKLYPHRMNGNIFTMYWDQFDEWNKEHQDRFAVIRTELMQKVDRSIAAYDAFRDTGNKLFANKLVEAKSDG